MKISVIGTGYVGLVSGACLAEVGNDVLCLDVDERKIRILESGEIPIHEPGLLEIVRRNVASGRLRFTTDPSVTAKHGLIQFIAVGTPPDEDGSADLQHVLAAARGIGRYMDDYRIVVDKSTVPVGTADKVRAAIAEELSRRACDFEFSVVSNPEFLKEGVAVADFMRPDRIVIGADDVRPLAAMHELYAPFQRNHERMVVMDVRSAELTKYASNAMLATRISFMNELALLAEDLDADIDLVRQGMGLDPRIGHHFLYSGCGYGGSCFPKDIKALIRTGQQHDRHMRLLQAVEDVNEAQKREIPRKITAEFGSDLTDRHFAVWGLAYKPETDDMREAPSRPIVADLLDRGATVCAYDPVAAPEARKVFGNHPNLSFAPTQMRALENADALVVVTEWRSFKSPDFDEIKALLKQPCIFDGRNLYAPATLAAKGIRYFGIGRGLVLRGAA
jgi:UDPglucose 6-dehydrogenase